MKLHPITALFPPMSKDGFASLKEDIGEHGILIPLLVWKDQIVDGRHRWLVGEELGIKDPPINDISYATEAAMGKMVLAMNAKRRDLNTSQRAMVAARLVTTELGTNQYGCSNLSTLSQPDAADAMLVSRGAVQQASKVIDYADSHDFPELTDAVLDRHIAVSFAANNLVGAETHQKEDRRLTCDEMREIVKTVVDGEDIDPVDALRLYYTGRKRIQLDDTKAIEAKEIEGVFDVIVIDPPWQMEKINRRVAPAQVAFEYPFMTEEELALPLKGKPLPCADDCHVWVWTTHKHLPMALRLLEQWGLSYVCTFVWHKPGGFQVVGLPQYNCEFALYARRGTPKFLDFNDFKVCFDAKRGDHSAKPEEFYDLVRRVTAGRRADIFNRREIEGFVGWGNEAPE